MSIASQLTEIASRINTEIASANATTSAGDTDLHEAVQSLIDGYGGEENVVTSSLIVTSGDGAIGVINEMNIPLAFQNEVILMNVRGKGGIGPRIGKLFFCVVQNGSIVTNSGFRKGYSGSVPPDDGVPDTSITNYSVVTDILDGKLHSTKGADSYIGNMNTLSIMQIKVDGPIWPGIEAE